jgi:hypothetical protein
MDGAAGLVCRRRIFPDTARSKTAARANTPFIERLEEQIAAANSAVARRLEAANTDSSAAADLMERRTLPLVPNIGHQ